MVSGFVGIFVAPNSDPVDAHLIWPSGLGDIIRAVDPPTCKNSAGNQRVLTFGFKMFF